MVYRNTESEAWTNRSVDAQNPNVYGLKAHSLLSLLLTILVCPDTPFFYIVFFFLKVSGFAIWVGY